MIEIQEITYRYPQAWENALNGVSLPVAEGAALGLLGPNGAGKTTLMSLLAGLLPVQGGQILFDGVPLGRLPAKERQRISLVPQDFAFYPLLSVWDNMRFFAALYAVRDEGYLKTLVWFSGSLCSNGSSCFKSLPITIKPLCCGRFFSRISRRKARRCVGRQPKP